MTGSEMKELETLKNRNANLKSSLEEARQTCFLAMGFLVLFAVVAFIFMFMFFSVSYSGLNRGAGYPANVSSLSSGERYVVEATICEKEKPCLALIRTESGIIKFIESPDTLEVGSTYLCYTNTTGSGKQRQTYYHLLKVER